MDNMEGFILIKQGAEAKLYKGSYLTKPALIKERFPKQYRHPQLDESLTKERIKSEARSIVRCKQAGIKTPMLYLVDFKRRVIIMEYFEHSITLKDFIETNELDVLLKLAIKVGAVLGKMHENNIIHGDLTSSNMLLVNKNHESSFTVDLSELDLVLIDFGLGHVESSAEDKGVDLYVLERALLSTHSIAEKIFPKIMEGYKQQNKKGFKEVWAKFEDVRARGRKRTMVG